MKSILNDVLIEEYYRMGRICRNMQSEMQQLPRGYISKKIIKGKPYYYLQVREKNKINSKYIKFDEVSDYQLLINRRNELKTEIKNLQAQRGKIVKVIGIKNIKNE